ncbi:MAG: glycerol-3-phosphate acyltransferase [Phycisphaerae bacterium]
MPTAPLNPPYWLILVLGGYLCGSIPWGVIIAKAKGVDIRKHGSGNIGATNVGRVLGRKLGLLCFFLDMLKGAAPVLVAGAVAGILGQIQIPPRETAWWLAVMASPVLGHIFNPWLRFKGGKGVATSLGALLGMFPPLTVPGLAAFGVWIVMAVRWRYVSLASIGAALSLPLFTAGFFAWKLPRIPGSLPTRESYSTYALPYVMVAAALAVLVVITHRSNIRRLLAGTENRIGHSLKKKPADAATDPQGR